MLKLEVRMDEDKIRAEGKYTVKSIYDALERSFANFHLNTTISEDGTLWFTGTGNSGDFGAFGSLITSLRREPWFMDYVTKWIWYNSDDGRNEDDFNVEDVLEFYRKKARRYG